MSQLAPFVRVLKALQKGFHEQAHEKAGQHFSSEALVLGGMSNAFGAAATDLEQQIAADLARIGRLNDPVEGAKRERILVAMEIERKRLDRPLLLSEIEAVTPRFDADAFDGLRRDGVVKPAFPYATKSDSGLQHWDFAHVTAK